MPPEIELRGEREEGELGISTRILGKTASYLLEWKKEGNDELLGVNNYSFYGVALDEQDNPVKPVCHACLEKKSSSFYYRLVPSQERPLIVIVCSDCKEDEERGTSFSFRNETVVEQLDQDALFRFKPLEMGALDEEEIRKSGGGLLEQAEKMAIDVYPTSKEERRKIVERVEEKGELHSP